MKQLREEYTISMNKIICRTTQNWNERTKMAGSALTQF